MQLEVFEQLEGSGARDHAGLTHEARDDGALRRAVLQHQLVLREEREEAKEDAEERAATHKQREGEEGKSSESVGEAMATSWSEPLCDGKDAGVMRRGGAYRGIPPLDAVDVGVGGPIEEWSKFIAERLRQQLGATHQVVALL